MSDAIRALETQLVELKAALIKARSEEARGPVGDYEFLNGTGAVRLSELFGDKNDLLVVHNMGASCNYCTLWADGFSGYLRHLEERAAFVVVSLDTPENQAKLAAARGWRFQMVQDATKAFTTAMGFWNESEGWWPGISAFHRKPDGSIERTGNAVFGPGDDFCLVWPMFEILEGGANGWEPH